MPKTKTPYENLHLIPSVIADTVCRREYKGQGDFDYSPQEIADTEKLRKKMTEERIAEFIAECDDRCKRAYDDDMDWILNCVKARGNKGRDKLYLFVQHWLVAFLQRKYYRKENPLNEYLELVENEIFPGPEEIWWGEHNHYRKFFKCIYVLEE